MLKYVTSQRSFGVLITKELIFGFQILDLKDHFSASLISAMVSSEIGLLSDRVLLAFGIVLSTAVLIAVTIQSAYLSRSLVDNSPEKSAEPSASSSVDSNSSRSVCSNLYLVWLVNVFLCGGGIN